MFLAALLPIAVTKSVIVVKSQEKAQYGEKDDNVASENESTWCPRNLQYKTMIYVDDDEDFFQ